MEQPRLPTEPIVTGEADIAATTADLDALHRALDQLWRRGEALVPSFPGERWRFEFVTAVVEIVANIVCHAYPAGAPDELRTVRLSFALRPDRIDAVLTDRGAAFVGDPDSAAPEADLLLESGRGLALARALLDELTYERRPDGTNRWHLMKRYST